MLIKSVFTIIILFNWSVWSQCNNSSPFGGVTIPAPGVTLNISTCNYASEYAIISGVNTTNTYTVASSVASDFITIRQGTPGGAVIASGVQPVNWTSAVAGNYYVHFNLNAACDTQNICRNTTLTTSASASGMSFSSFTVSQNNNADVETCSLDNKEVIGIEVVTAGSSSPLDLTQIRLKTNGSNSPLTDISNIDIYYTGNSSTFALTTLFGSSAPANTGTNIPILGTQTLAPGTNYFWVVYDINPLHTAGNNIDAICNRIKIDGTNYTPSITNPGSGRTLAACPSSPGGIDTGILLWTKADAGITTLLGNVIDWSDQSSAFCPIILSGSPDFVSVGKNYNPIIDFTIDITGGGDYLSTTDLNVQSIFMAGKLSDVTRVSSHIATYDQVTFAGPCFHCALHGGNNGSGVAQYSEINYGNANFQGTSVWRQNGLPVSYTNPHSGNFDIISTLGDGTGAVNRFFGGQVDNLPILNARARDWFGPIGELIVYSGPISPVEANKIESYLAIKYGITLGGNGATTIEYNSANGSTIYPSNSGYHNDIIGIGRDDIQSLIQKQSTTDDNVTQLYLSSLNTSNILNSGTFNDNNSYVLMGDNQGALCSSAAANIENTSLCGTTSRMEREWKMVRTNNEETVNLKIQLDPCALLGMVNIAQLRFLVDNDGDFSNGGTNCYFNGDGSGISISYSSPTITISGISTTHIPNNNFKFFTIGSTNINTPLPADLFTFNVKLIQANQGVIHWTTETEINTDYFQVEKSNNGVDWKTLTIVNSIGNSSSITEYETIDDNVSLGTNYYRLKTVDNNGYYEYSDIKTINRSLNFKDVRISPNPSYGKFQVNFETKQKDLNFKLYDLYGKIIQQKHFENCTSFSLNIDESKGVYFLELTSDNNSIIKKLVKK